MATTQIKKHNKMRLKSGPYNGFVYQHSWGLQETLPFVAKGIYGMYRGGVWEPLIPPVEVGAKGFIPFKKAIKL